MELFRIIVLGLSGLMLCYGGGSRLVAPAKSFALQTYLAKPGIRLEDDPDMANEMRGGGAVTLVAGLVAFFGIVVADARATALAVAAVIFLGFALGRLISRALDGTPNKDLVQGTFAELVLGVLNIVGLATLVL